MYPLTDAELEKYYANIFAVAAADGQRTAGEDTILETVRKALKIKKSILVSAENAVQNGSHQLTPVGTFANQVDNLEQMVAVALADGELNGTEATLVATFARAIGLTQEQMDSIVAGVKQKLTPPSLVVGTPAALQFTPPATGIGIEFPEKTSPDFANTLNIASRAPVFQECIQARKKWYLAAWPDGFADETLALAQNLGWVPGRCVWVDGQKRTWTEVFRFLECAKERCSAYSPDKYCFGLDGDGRELNPWGCRKFNMYWTRWGSDPDWLTYGQWEGTGCNIRWRFDKPRILHQLRQARAQIGPCPFLSADLPEAFLASLPETVSPFSDPDWTYRVAEDTTPGAWHVTIKENEDGYSFTRDICILGVAPKSPNLLLSILNRLLSPST